MNAGGFFINTADIPRGWVWAEYVSWIKYSFSGVGSSVFGYDYPNLDGCTKGPNEPCAFKTGDDVSHSFICIYFYVFIFFYFLLNASMYRDKSTHACMYGALESAAPALHVPR